MPSEEFLRALGKKPVRPSRSEFAVVGGLDLNDFSPLTTGLDVKNRNVRRTNWFHVLGKFIVGGLPDPPEHPEDQVLAVRFQNERVLSLTQSGFYKDIGQLRLEPGMQMNFGLLDRHNRAG